MIGTTLGHYKVTERIGAGGMGIVYKARDLHLDRFVALKILPHEKVAEPERKRRFVQEAKAASALNHPNIVHVYDIDQADGTDFIAMEYVEGRTLDQLIPGKGMRLGEALKCSAQIADALAAAHTAGIVHRDLKPANVMVTEKGLVKVLDFGLAKLAERTESDELGTTETMEPRTEEGTILGTVAYMSPEQAEGRKIDTRSDIFSFGSMLYEMLTGQRAFGGHTRVSTMAAILRDEPKLIAEAAGAIPRDVEKLVRRCLQKDVQRRFQHMDDVKIALEELKEESESGVLRAAVPVVARRVLPAKYAVIAVAAVVILAAGAYWLTRQRSNEQEAPLTAGPLTSYAGEEACPSFSPDGTQVAFQWCTEGPSANCDIYVKQISVEPPQRLTFDPADNFSPAWSPDGQFIAFLRRLSLSDAALLVIPQRGGEARVLVESGVSLPTDVTLACLAWTLDSKWLAFPWAEPGKSDGGLFLLSVETLEKRRLTEGKDANPAFSPDGRTLAFARGKGGAGSDTYLLHLGEGGVPRGAPELVASGHPFCRGVAWTPDGSEIVLAINSYGSGGLWRMAASASAKSRRLPVVSEDVWQPAISLQGNRLAYTVPQWKIGIWGVELRGMDRKPGAPFRLVPSTRSEACPAYSPDGKRIAFTSDRSGHFEIWKSNSDGSNAVQLTSFASGEATGPSWSPDGREFAFMVGTGGEWSVYVMSANGSAPRRLTSERTGAMPWPCWAPDGRSIYFVSSRSGSSEIWKIPAAGGDAVQVTRNGGNLPQVSPDGRLLYYSKSDRDPEQCSVWRMPVGGGQEAEVIDSVNCDGLWAALQQGVYFIGKPDEKRQSDIRFYEFATGKTSRIMTVDREMFKRVAVSPDGRTILWPQYDQGGSDLMLVKNFR